LAIAVSSVGARHVGKRLDLAFEDMGERLPQNIEAPIRVYSIQSSTPPQMWRRQSGRSDRPSPSSIRQHERRPGKEYFSDALPKTSLLIVESVGSLCRGAPNRFTYKGKHVDVQKSPNVSVSILFGRKRAKRAGARCSRYGQLINREDSGHLC